MTTAARINELAEAARRAADDMARKLASVARARHSISSMNLTEACDIHREAQVAFNEALHALRDAALAAQASAVPAGWQPTPQRLTNLQTWLCCRLIGNAAMPSEQTTLEWIADLAQALGTEVPTFAARRLDAIAAAPQPKEPQP